ncbi:uncharacterized protein F4822DRAFT_105241 [Hypoxylon trugodes]|uniref:uncharacterized protein n=1 Tax=Hypoxylon trugodes TaxID=326681 RepID=UPI0021992F8A|nr:uncharacterized protein F4822DRAFT_105241 [Hypoxylon trugodes]KAI1391774.1 hypothetical protein F4822DRAFT_105241 [Hypoxylon trugodes]
MSGFRWSTDNFDEPEPISNRPDLIWGVVIACLIFSWVCVCLRLYVRLRVVRAPGWDDLCVVLYLFMVTAGSIAVCCAVTFGLGKHFLQLEEWQGKSFLKTFYIANATYVTATALIKEALLLQYLRVFERAVILRRFLIFLVVFTALWGIAYSFLAWAPCIPVHDFWNGGGPLCYGYGSQYIRPFVATFESHAASNMVLDILVLVIPLPLLFKDGTTNCARVRVVGLISMGIFVLVFAVWRLITIIDHQVASWPTRDPTWYGPISIILAVLEIDAASVCASVPIFWPVISSMNWGKIFVTQEVNITRETRYMEDDEDELTRDTTHSRTGSEAELGESGRKGARNKGMYYQDSYVLSHVDPLRSSAERVHASAISDMAKNGSKKWVKI